jgi:hypothetical protein
MAVTRINNNQITDASAGNVYLGINANTKLQNYSITSNKIANNLTYGSDLTVSGNLTVNGTSTAIDTTITTIEDPVIVLASTQTGAPAVDIGFLGERGTANNIAFVWNEANAQFVTAFTNTSETNTTISIIGYADLRTSNLVVGGTTSLIGNVVGTANFTGNVNAGNVNSVNIVSAASTVGGVITGSSTSVTGSQTAASTVGGVITGSSTSVTGSQTAASTVGGVITGSSTSVTGSQTAASTVGGVITGSSVSVTGNVNATGNVTAANFIGNIQGNVSASGANTEILFNDGGIANATSGFTFDKTSNLVTVGGNVNAINFNGNVFGTSVSASGTVTAASTVGGVITGSSTSVTGSQTAASTVGGVITGSSTSVTGTQTAASTVGGVITGSSSSVTGAQSAASTVGGVITGSSSSVTGAQTAASTVGGIITGSSVSVTGNVTGGNLVSATVTNPTVMTISTNAGNINLEPTGNVVVNNTYINGLQLTPQQDSDAASKYYVDTIATTGITIHEAVYAATTTALSTATGGTITYTQPNGVSNGIGAYLQTTGTFTTIDTANVQTVGTRILVKDQANAVQNGVYVYSNATAITRSSDTDQYGSNSAEEFSINDYFFTQSGSVNAGAAFVVSAPPGVITFGTSNIQFAQFSSSQTYTANTSAGISINGTVISAKVDNNTTAFDGLGNISVKAGANLTTPNIGAATGTSLSVTGAVTAASTVGGVITGSSSSVTGTQTAASTVGGVITGSSTSVTGTQTAASTVGGVITGSSSSVTGTQTAASTVGGVITGSSTSVTGNVDATSFNGNVYGTTVSATGNITGGNLLTSGAGGAISGTGNITGGNILTAGNVSATGNVMASWLIGNIQGSVSAPGANTEIIFNDTGVSNATSGFTFNKTSNTVTVGGNVDAVSFNGNVYGTSVSASGTVTAASTVGGVITGSSSSVTGTQTAASTVGGVITGSSVSVTGDVSGSNLSISGGNITSSAAAITVNGTSGDVNFAVNGDTTTIFFTDAGTETASFGSTTQVTNAIVTFNATNSIVVPVGNTAQRPATGVTGMQRFNTTTNSLEMYYNSAWTDVGAPVFTVIADQQFNGDGTTVNFTLSSTQTTNSCIVSINGVVQIPTLAYAVAGTDPTCVLTFTEAPETGDIIDVRQITTTTSVTSISNQSGNAVVAASSTAAQINVTGDLSVSGSILGGNINSTAITSGTSNMSIVSSGGNIRGNVAGTTVMTISPGLVDIVGNLTVSGNATLSGNILGDRIQNGTTSIDIQTPSGNANITVGGTSNVAVFTTTGAFVTGVVSASGNITGDNVLTNGLISATGNVSGGNLNVTGNIVDTGALTVSTGSNGNITLAPNGTGNVNITGNVMPTANATANIGSAALSYNTIFAKATSAQYADLAEKYTADATYAPGTVVAFGGTHEVTVSTQDADRRVAGVVSTNPSYIMNGGLEGANIATVALTGRVPTRVTGTVAKGDLMVSAGDGTARAEADPRAGAIIGKALENSEGDATIEVVVGRF